MQRANVSLGQAFPKADKAHTRFLDDRAAFSQDEVEEEIKYVQLLASLVIGCGAQCKGTPDVDLQDETGAPQRLAAHNALAVRTLHVARLVLQTWKHTHSWQHREYIYHVLAVVHFIVNVSPLFRNSVVPAPTSFRFRFPLVMPGLEVMHTSLLVAVSWANVMTGASSPFQVLPHAALSTSKLTPHISWDTQVLVLSGMQFYHHGAYKKARKALSRARTEHKWQPPSLYQVFLDSSPKIYEPDDAPPAPRPVSPAASAAAAKSPSASAAAASAPAHLQESPIPPAFDILACVKKMQV